MTKVLLVPDDLAAAFLMAPGVSELDGYGAAMVWFAQRQDADEPDLVKYREAAKKWCTEDGVLEVDDNAIVSKGDDPGAYVQCWRWVEDDLVSEDD